MYELNRRYYDVPAVVEKYAADTALQRAEEAILERLRTELARARLLEIGVGPGRTAPHLRRTVRRYVGIDCSAAMLAPCRRRFPDACLVLCDGRRLAFPAEAFDAVYFCWNAIDDAGHRDRLAMLDEIRRVLRPGGAFFFSTHNRGWPPHSPYTSFRPYRSANPLKLIGGNLRSTARYAFGILNHLRHRRLERQEPEYAIVNESPLDFRTLTYFIDRRQQVGQLERAGFGSVEMVDLDGRWITADEACGDPWIYYLARRNG